MRRPNLRANNLLLLFRFAIVLQRPASVNVPVIMVEERKTYETNVTFPEILSGEFEGESSIAMEAVILIGIQASGKSSFYKERFFDTHVRINLDMLKTKHRQRVLLNACLKGKQPFVVDNTNVTAEMRSYFIAPARAAGFRVLGYYLRTDVSVSLSRNSQREERWRVPDKGLLGTYQQLKLPRREEGFDALYYVRINEAGDFVVEEWVDEVR